MPSVELLTPGQTIDLDPESAERLDAFLMNIPSGIVEECHKFTLCITGADRGLFYMPPGVWRGRFETSLGRRLQAHEMRLASGSVSESLWDALYAKRREVRGRG
jgi:hypothetical protein